MLEACYFSNVTNKTRKMLTYPEQPVPQSVHTVDISAHS